MASDGEGRSAVTTPVTALAETLSMRTTYSRGPAGGQDDLVAAAQAQHAREPVGEVAGQGDVARAQNGRLDEEPSWGA